jgi:hypothetical protein
VRSSALAGQPAGQAAQPPTSTQRELTQPRGRQTASGAHGTRLLDGAATAAPAAVHVRLPAATRSGAIGCRCGAAGATPGPAPNAEGKAGGGERKASHGNGDGPKEESSGGFEVVRSKFCDR